MSTLLKSGRARLLLCLILVPTGLSVPAESAESQLPRPLLESLHRAGVPLSAVSLLVQPLDGSRPLISLNPEVARNPASVIKLITTYTALSTLGPGYRWPTDIHVLGPLEKGVLKGDLGIRGHGDPYMLIEDLWNLTRELRRRGIHKIEGDLVLDATYFVPFEEDMGAFDGRPARTYNLLPNALMVNFQTIHLIFNHAGGGEGVEVDLVPNLPNLRIENRLKSVPGPCEGFNAGIAVKVSNLPRRDLVELDGLHPRGCSGYSLSRTVLTPAAYFFGLFKLLWEEQGGELAGQYREESLAVGENEEPGNAENAAFYRWYSSPIREVLVSANKFSNNTMTRQLLLTVAAESTGRPGKVEDGIHAVRDFLRNQDIDIRGLNLVNGSGLSREARADARMLVSMLLNAYRSPWGAEFISSLPISGVDGTLRKRLVDSEALGMGHIKTGRLDHVVALAGFIQSHSGARYALAFMINHSDIHRKTGDDIGDLLIEWLHLQ